MHASNYQIKTDSFSFYLVSSERLTKDFSFSCSLFKIHVSSVSMKAPCPLLLSWLLVHVRVVSQTGQISDVCQVIVSFQMYVRSNMQHTCDRNFTAALVARLTSTYSSAGSASPSASPIGLSAFSVAFFAFLASF